MWSYYSGLAKLQFRHYARDAYYTSRAERSELYRSTLQAPFCMLSRAWSISPRPLLPSTAV